MDPAGRRRPTAQAVRTAPLALQPLNGRHLPKCCKSLGVGIAPTWTTGDWSSERVLSSTLLHCIMRFSVAPCIPRVAVPAAPAMRTARPAPVRRGAGVTSRSTPPDRDPDRRHEEVLKAVERLGLEKQRRRACLATFGVGSFGPHRSRRRRVQSLVSMRRGQGGHATASSAGRRRSAGGAEKSPPPLRVAVSPGQHSGKPGRVAGKEEVTFWPFAQGFRRGQHLALLGDIRSDHRPPSFQRTHPETTLITEAR